MTSQRQAFWLLIRLPALGLTPWMPIPLASPSLRLTLGKDIPVTLETPSVITVMPVRCETGHISLGLATMQAKS